jgi:hypothetical protein
MSVKTIVLSGTDRVIETPDTAIDVSLGDYAASDIGVDTPSIDISITDFGPLSDRNIVDNYREVYNVDAFSILDSAAIAFTKSLADTMSATDAITSIDVSKILHDTYSVIDSISAIDLTKSLSDTVSIADTNYISMSKVLDDTISFTSTGACLIQSYNDNTYFAEDYAVGSYAQLT